MVDAMDDEVDSQVGAAALSMTIAANICHLEKRQPGPHSGQPEAFPRQAQGLSQGTGDEVSQLRASWSFGFH
jgi:hypothetical protein